MRPRAGQVDRAWLLSLPRSRQDRGGLCLATSVGGSDGTVVLAGCCIESSETVEGLEVVVDVWTGQVGFDMAVQIFGRGSRGFAGWKNAGVPDWWLA